MPMVIREDRGVSRVVVLCDWCSQEITDAKNGNYHWRGPLNAKVEAEPIYFTHKECCHSFETQNPEDGFLWLAMELICFPLYLENNLNIKRKEMLQTARMCAMLG